MRIALIVICCFMAASNVFAKEPTYHFDKKPFVHPRIVEDLNTWLSDGGDQVVSINLTDSQHSNRYFGDITLKEIEGANPWVCYKEEITNFCYQYIGQTENGWDVLYISEWGGGSGTFKTLMFVELVTDQGLYFDDDDLTITQDRERVLIRKLGDISLGDRWSGDLSVLEGRIKVGKNRGHYAGREGYAPYWQENKDQVITIKE